MAQTVVSMSISKQASLLFSIFISSRAVRLFFLYGPLMLKPFWCLVHPHSSINSENVNFQTLIKLSVSAFSFNVDYILEFWWCMIVMADDSLDIYFVGIAMLGQLLLMSSKAKIITKKENKAWYTRNQFQKSFTSFPAKYELNCSIIWR